MFSFPIRGPRNGITSGACCSRHLCRLLAGKLAPNGYVHCATDWHDYAEHILGVFSADPNFANLHAGYSPAPENPLCARPVTKFHARGDRLGHATYDLVFTRRR